MKNFSNSAPESNFKVKDLYLGKDEFSVIAVNPKNAELKELGLYTTEEEPVYYGSQEMDGKYVKFANITLILESEVTGNIEKLNYRIANSSKLSSSGKMLVINKYGGDAWLEPGHVESNSTPPEMSWYVTDGMRPQYIGEKMLIDFIRAHRRLKTVSKDTSAEERSERATMFAPEDVEKLFKGDFSDIRNLIMSLPENKVCMVLGIRTTDDNKQYQDMYKDIPLQSYNVRTSNNDFIIKKITDSQENGRYDKTYFDLNDLSLKKYDPKTMNVDSPKPTASSEFDAMPNSFMDDEVIF